MTLQSPLSSSRGGRPNNSLPVRHDQVERLVPEAGLAERQIDDDIFNWGEPAYDSDWWVQAMASLAQADERLEGELRRRESAVAQHPSATAQRAVDEAHSARLRAREACQRLLLAEMKSWAPDPATADLSLGYRLLNELWSARTGNGPEHKALKPVHPRPHCRNRLETQRLALLMAASELGLSKSEILAAVCNAGFPREKVRKDLNNYARPGARTEALEVEIAEWKAELPHMLDHLDLSTILSWYR